MNRKTVNILVFGIGMFMFLLRPYLVYRLTEYSSTDKNPVKSALLQRLVKKKDDHYESFEHTATEARSSKFSFQLLVRRISLFHFQNLLSTTAVCLTTLAMLTNVMLLWRSNHRYSFLSCFRI